jgi:hypothetical protein
MVVGLCRWAGLRIWQAIVCILFGFTLASSPAAPTISQAIRDLIDLL